MSAQERDDIERELRRVVDRLTSLPLTRLVDVGDACQRAATVLLDRTRVLDPRVPEAAALPDLQPQGLGAMIAVLGRDYLAVCEGDPEPGVALDALVTLRRTLP